MQFCQRVPGKQPNDILSVYNATVTARDTPSTNNRIGINIPGETIKKLQLVAVQCFAGLAMYSKPIFMGYGIQYCSSIYLAVNPCHVYEFFFGVHRRRRELKVSTRLVCSSSFGEPLLRSFMRFSPISGKRALYAALLV